jgi:ubiquitin-activating enzyme E1
MGDIEMVNANGGVTVHIDEDLHSRQLAVYGKESMRRMASSNVLIIGLSGLGVEIAKNVILAGLKSVTLHDPAPVETRNLGAQFYLSATDVGKPRAEACRESLQELNTSVSVTSSTEELSETFLGGFDVVVATQSSMSEAIRIDEICRKHGKSFIKADVRGVFASVFCDFGQQFEITDVDGEQPHSGIVAGITPGASTLVTSVEDDRLEFEAGDMVLFSEVEGMNELNSVGPVKVLSAKPHSLEVDVDSSAFGGYIKGGIVTQVKQPKSLNFKSLAESIESPGEFLVSDFSKFERPPLLHVGFRAVEEFITTQGRAPRPGDAGDAESVLDIANRINTDESIKVDEKVMAHLASTWSSELNPMAAAFGGVVGQEVVKAASGKFHPIFQWFYFDSIESLPEDPLGAEEVAPEGGRYDDQIAVFGRTMQRKFEAANVFLVGAGALGCEFLKNLALMGIACGPSGKLTVTDDDTIEKSNLSRQFLFRDWDIGNAKSSVAGEAARKINPNFNVEALQNRVSPETEQVFNDNFWSGKDLIVNALDNVNARLYVDSRCVYFGKPLLESGTLGTKCNTQNIIPGLTENYGATRDPPEKSAPMCTLHSFPHNIQHCLTFARSEFEGLLEKTPADVNAYLENPEKYVHDVTHSSDAAAKENLKRVVDALIVDRCSSFDDCIEWARVKFQTQFYERIKQLTYTFPEDAKTSTGALFWSAPKRFPTALEFNASDESHAAFIQAAAILKAQVHNISIPDWAYNTNEVVQKAAKISIPEFVPKDNVKIETDPKKDAANQATDDAGGLDTIEAMVADLEKVAKSLPEGYRLTPIAFEKDDDTNFHMQFIAGFANMRARNYAIPEVEKLQAKLIAGRIIPAIATTTALATGLVGLEMYKVFRNAPVEAYRDSFANLALPLFAMAEPKPPQKFEYKDMSWTLWDRWILEGDLTVNEVLDWFKKKGLNAYSISCGQALLYNNIFPRHKDRLGQKMSDLVKTVAKMDIPPWRNHFDVVVACEDEEDEDMDVPLVSIQFR